MALVDPMYQYSLLYFVKLYTLRIQRCATHEVLAERLKLLIADLTEAVYGNICRGLFEKDKLLFSFLIAANIGMFTTCGLTETRSLFMVITL